MDVIALTQITQDELASRADRVGSLLVDGILEAIPFVGAVVQLVNLTMYRRGRSIGLTMARARILRENGDVAGFFHTSVRGAAGVLSAIPLGLGFWWAFWDPWRQTWHDKLLHTYVVRDTEELAYRNGTSSDAAKLWFWVILGPSLAGGLFIGLSSVG